MATLVDSVLKALIEAGGEPVSGQELAASLGVTRAAVWKSVTALREEGYVVESVHGLGYRLAGGKGTLRPGELSALLGTKTFGRHHRHYAATNSTSRRAAEWAEGGAPEGALVTADSQSAGRGRLGRQWFGEPGESLAMTVILRPEVELSLAPLLTFVAAISLAETLLGWVEGEAVEVKWPNDVLLGGRKVAGILLESRVEGVRIDYLSLGVGVNVLGTPARFPEEFRESAATLEEFSKADCPAPVEVLSAYLQRLEGDYFLFSSEGFGPFRERWGRLFRMAGREVTVVSRGGELRGKVLGLAEDGALELETGGGIKRILAGDVSFSTTRK
ncbi:biotin--[acetyl-CoA-carboxylase] ligase [bacterium]|nr:MAG: biotin--[acetyl-CoA-carboxylase] ligase [bacterium]